MRAALLVVIGLTALGAVACNTVFGIEEGNLVDGVGACPAGCVPAAPAGWSGPVSLSAGSCADPNPVEAIVAFRGPTADAVTCSACTSTSSGDVCLIGVTAYTDTSCATQQGGTVMAVSSTAARCLPTTSGTSIRFVNMQAANGVCSPPTAQKPTKPTPTWTETVRGCAPAQLAACGGASACVSKLGDSTCVYAAGEQACPAEYPNGRDKAFKNLDDQRSCTACGVGTHHSPGSCGPDPGEGFANLTCGGGVSSTLAYDECVDGDNAALASILLDASPVGYKCTVDDNPGPHRRDRPSGPGDDLLSLIVTGPPA